MKTFLCFIFGGFVMIFAKVQACDEKGVVYYEGFEVERYFPLSEEMIEKYGYRCEISRTDFLLLIQRGQKETNDAVKYEKRDVRAKVIFLENDVYFISKNGGVRHGQNYSVIDKEEFKKVVHCFPRNEVQ
jgi:hypothetical protein